MVPIGVNGADKQKQNQNPLYIRIKDFFITAVAAVVVE
jgi:hypothetical protein